MFKRREDHTSLKRYLQFLQLMELGEQDLLVVLRRNAEASIPSWARETFNRFGNVKVRGIVQTSP